MTFSGRKVKACVFILSGILVLLLMISAYPGVSHAETTAREILEKVDDMWRGTSSYAEMTMEVVTAHWERTLKLRAWSKGKEYSLVLITFPKKERGLASLKVQNDIFNYLPRVNRTIRVPSSMMMGSWMGSHFTNDDLVKESRMSDDYTVQIAFEGIRDGLSIYELVLLPKPEAPVVWGKIEITVEKTELIPIKSLYFDEDEQLIRTMDFTDVRIMGGRKIPATLILVPTDKPDERTFIRYDSMDFDIDLDESFFSLRNLSRRDLVQ
ncbi:MAG: outer membrane lipoprotein-sorting protein [bacterium]